MNYLEFKKRFINEATVDYRDRERFTAWSLVIRELSEQHGQERWLTLQEVPSGAYGDLLAMKKLMWG